MTQIEALQKEIENLKHDLARARETQGELLNSTRESSKRLVQMAQEFMRRTNNYPEAPLPKDDDTIRYLIEYGRSMAGSIISQADPND